MDDCCPGSTIDVTVGDANITLHTHALLTPELLDTMLARMTARATAAEGVLLRIHDTIRRDQED